MSRLLNKRILKHFINFASWHGSLKEDCVQYIYNHSFPFSCKPRRVILMIYYVYVQLMYLHGIFSVIFFKLNCIFVCCCTWVKFIGAGVGFNERFPFTSITLHYLYNHHCKNELSCANSILKQRIIRKTTIIVYKPIS